MKMKKRKYSLTISSDSKDTLEVFHNFMVNDGEQYILISDGEIDSKVYYSEIVWNIKNKKDLDLYIERSEVEYE